MTRFQLLTIFKMWLKVSIGLSVKEDGDR